MRPRKYDVPRQVLIANYPIDMMDSVWVIEPSGNIIKMYPLLHSDESELKVLKCFLDKRSGNHMVAFSFWAEEAGYLALDEELDKEGRIDDFKWIVKQDEKIIEARRNGIRMKADPIPDEYLPQIVLDRRAKKTPELAPFKFPEKDKKKSTKKKDDKEAAVG